MQGIGAPLGKHSKAELNSATRNRALHFSKLREAKHNADSNLQMNNFQENYQKIEIKNK